MFELPEYVRYALGKAGYDEYPNDELARETFLHRWGGLEKEAFARALNKGESDERVLAIFALGYDGTVWARELLLPFLESPRPQERWASALELGKMREEQAFPLLIAMLTEFLPPREWPSYLGDDLWLYNNWREMIFLILAEWAKPEAVPALLDALAAYRKVEQLIPESITTARRYWRQCQGRVMYALGWLGRFDILAALAVAEPMLSSWKVHLALGSLHAHLDYPEIFTAVLRIKPALYERVVEVLTEKYGFSKEELENCLAAFEDMKW